MPIMYKSLKPILDFTLAFVLVMLCIPLMACISLVLYIHFDGKVFFIQKRIGFQERDFFILKFRTMHDSTDKDGQLLPDEKRTTKLGMLLRNSGLDELPQLLNILKGEMSFVGPRPLLPEYLPLYDSSARKRHYVKPGITGLAQINGGNGLEWKKRFELDIFYAENITFFLDLSIMLSTMLQIMKAKGENIGKMK